MSHQCLILAIMVIYRSFPLRPSLPFPLFVKLSERAWSQAPIEETKLSLKILRSNPTVNQLKTYLLQHQQWEVICNLPFCLCMIMKVGKSEGQKVYAN